MKINFLEIAQIELDEAVEYYNDESHGPRCFPYGIIYQFRKTEILIVAIAHLHRNPDYWKNRI